MGLIHPIFLHAVADTDSSSLFPTNLLRFRLEMSRLGRRLNTDKQDMRYYYQR